MKALALTLAASVLLLCGSNALAAGSASRGLEKSQACQACHGKDGNLAVTPDTPIIAGQHAGYLEYALKQYRSGERQNAQMNGFASGLSDQDIADLAAWYASQEGLVTPQLDEN
ncbi:c-type cytochrome [Wenzhouxiangella sediminis]|uniref:Cytochrome c n=1 Tax=Wenzhouxiangella sediminis TaxID=1792836 RepID=A0A3E1KDX0_9GAMM|nr:cytochrome c [Wenzhouxiangella sediminis]RFF32816.1 cytochrome c [Wenzhouxiangella sediminis]